MKIVMGSDRAGMPLKEHLKQYLTGQGHTVVDVGSSEQNFLSHPIAAREATQEYLKGGYDFGIVICASGTGICIAANKVRGVRCALVQNFYSAKAAKEFNKANFIAFGGATLHPLDAQALVAAYISHQYLGEKVAQWDREIDEIERSSLAGNA